MLSGRREMKLEEGYEKVKGLKGDGNRRGGLNM